MLQLSQTFENRFGNSPWPVCFNVFFPFHFKDQEIPVDETVIFFNAPVVTTSGYLARAIVNNVLRGSILTQSRLNVPDHSCPVQ